MLTQKNKKRIMVIDDDKSFLEEFKETLDLSGFDVVAVNDPLLIIEKAVQQKPDLILLDLKMPKKTGFQVAEELRQYKELSHIPVIAITGFFTEMEHSLLMNICGIKKCLKKPLNPSEIILEINELIK